MLNMSERSRRFLEKEAPNILEYDRIRPALDDLYLLIEIKGFNKDDRYNEFGIRAQEVYDDLYENND